MRKILGIIIALFPLTFSISCSLVVTVDVAFVIDGDTFADSKDNRYRIFGVDTPEYQWLEEDEEPDIPIRQVYAEKAAIESRLLIEGKIIEIEKIELDVYDRLICKWIVDDYDIGIHLVYHGFGRVEYISTSPGDAYYTDDYEYYEALLSAQKHAYDNQLGIWEDYENYKELFD